MALSAGIALGESEPVRHVWELYSWRGALGGPTSKEGWEFSILTGATSSRKQPSEIFAPSVMVRGLDELEKCLDLLPPNSDVIWIEAVRKMKKQGNEFVRAEVVKGTERLALPPPEVMNHVRRMVRARGFRFVGVTGGDHTTVEE